MAMPGTFVVIGLNSPRYSAEAPGFRSNVSMWLGPPHSQRTMIALLRAGVPETAARLSSLSRSARLKLVRPMRPERRNARRFKVPGQGAGGLDGRVIDR